MKNGGSTGGLYIDGYMSRLRGRYRRYLIYLKEGMGLVQTWPFTLHGGAPPKTPIKRDTDR